MTTSVTSTVTATTTATATSTATVTASPAAATFTALLGPWSGHTRGLTVTSTGIASESISDGCCSPQIDLTLQLKNPTGSSANAKADAVVIAVHVFPGYPSDAPKPPAVGAVGTVTVKNGVFADSWLGVTFCDEAQATKGTCGA